VEVIKTIYDPDLVSTFSLHIEMAVNVPNTKEVAFTLVSNKKYKEKGKAFSLFLCLSLTLEARNYSFYRLPKE